MNPPSGRKQFGLLVFAGSPQLMDVGAKNPLYTPMGGWDEGYYVDPVSKKKIIIGLSGSHTAYQSNWVLFRK